MRPSSACAWAPITDQGNKRNGVGVGVRFEERRLPTLRNLPRATVTIRFWRRHRCVIVPTRLGEAPVIAAMSLAVNVGGNRSKIWCQLVFPQKLATS